MKYGLIGFVDPCLLEFGIGEEGWALRVSLEMVESDVFGEVGYGGWPGV